MRVLTFLFLAIITLYQRLISPIFSAFGGQCRFYPSCSAYAKQAIETHGIFKGACLTGLRLLKCAPYHPGGIDRVPETEHQLKEKNCCVRPQQQR